MFRVILFVIFVLFCGHITVRTLKNFTLIRKAQVENDQMLSHHEDHEDHEGKTEHMRFPLHDLRVLRGENGVT